MHEVFKNKRIKEQKMATALVYLLCPILIDIYTLR